MELKTRLTADEGRQDLWISREFDLPLPLLFMAYKKPEIIEQWMGTKVLTFEPERLGHYEFETTDPMGNKHIFCGTIHEFEPNHKITRTFEMVNTSFPVQLEFLIFEQLTPETSRLSMHIVFKSEADRNNLLKLPFAQGINGAHNRIQEIVNRLKQQNHE